jgi:uncharacterized protein
MSQENVEVVRKAVEAFIEGDFDRALDFFDAEVVYEVTSATGPEPGVYQGHDGLRRAFGPWMASWDEYEFGLHELIDAGDHVVAVGWDRGRAKASGVPVERPDVAFVYEVRNGTIVNAWMYATKADAFAAVDDLGAG